MTPQDQIPPDVDQTEIASPELSKLQTYADQVLKAAVEVQQLIKTAKTQTKRDFYSKKMGKLRKDLHQLLATIELVKLSERSADATDTANAQ